MSRSPEIPCDQMEVATACTKEFWSNRLATTTFCAVFWTFGLCIGFLGPTLLDLDCQVGESRLGTSTWLFFSQTALMLVGSLMVGLYLTQMSIEMLLFQAVLVSTLTLLLIPFCGSLVSLAFILIIMGYHLGLIDAGGNIAMIQLHHSNVQPFLQAMHFFYGLGAFVSPMIAAPFLREGECNTALQSTANRSFFIIPFRNKSDGKQWSEATRLHWAFWIMAASQIPILLLLLCLICTNKTATGSIRTKGDYETLNAVDDEEIAKQPTPRSQITHETPLKCLSQYTSTQLVFLLLAGCMLFLADGIQGGFADYVFTFGKLRMSHLSSADAAHLNATFWGLFTMGRLLAIFFAIWLSPWHILTIDISGCMLSLLLLVIKSDELIVLFFTAAGIGLFLASMAPACLSLAENTIGVTPSATTALVFMAALGEIIFPLITGNSMTFFGPFTFPLSLIGATCLVLLAYAACLSLKRHANLKHSQL